MKALKLLQLQQAEGKKAEKQAALNTDMETQGASPSSVWTLPSTTTQAGTPFLHIPLNLPVNFLRMLSPVLFSFQF